MDNTSKNYAFVLGREQKLALAELEAVLHTFGFCFDIYRITGNVAFAKLQDFSEEEAEKLVKTLAGTIKIVELKSEYTSTNLLDIMSAVANKYFESQETKFNFGISSYSKKVNARMVNYIGINLKQILKKNGLKPRFVQISEGNELSSIQVLKNNLHTKGLEIVILDEQIGITIALNNPEDWANIDYGKPASDKFSGMLPPRLARTMINLSVGQMTNGKCQISNKNLNDEISNDLEIRNLKLDIPQNEVIVVDPFCGSGNVLLEALQLGYSVIGSDISEKAVRDSKANCDWLISQQSAVSSREPLQTANRKPPTVFQADATSKALIDELKASRMPQNVVFVAEPYLGRPKKFNSSYNATVGEYKEIKKLYVGFLENLKRLVNEKQLTICMVFPAVETSDGNIFHLFKECVDEIKNLGYTQVRNSFLYGRDYQVVKREIVLLKLQ